MEVSQHQLPLNRKQSSLLRERDDSPYGLSSSRDSLPTSLILHASCSSDPDGELEPLSSISLTKRTHHTWPSPAATKRQRLSCPMEDSLAVPLASEGDLLPAEEPHDPPIPTDERLHICKWDECFKEFTSLKELGQHLRSHIEKQKDTNRQCKKSGYVCKWENCSRTTPFKGCYNLEHHLRYQHTGERPYQCDSCTSSFAQRSDLTEHLQNIHNLQPTSRKKLAATSPASGLGAFASPYPMYHEVNSPAEKIQQLMTPRTRPIPILPAPLSTAHTMGPIADYSSYLHPGPVDSDARGQTPYTLSEFPPMTVNAHPARYLVRSGDSENASVLMSEDGGDLNHLMLPLRTSEGDNSGLYTITPSNSFIPLPSSSRTISHAGYPYDYNDVALDHPDNLDWLDPGEHL